MCSVGESFKIVNRVCGCLALLAFAMLGACAEGRRSNLPPSSTDLALLAPAHLCAQKHGVLQGRTSLELGQSSWGAGEEIRIRSSQSLPGAEESFFFDENDRLVGALFLFPSGLDLKPYPVLRRTLSQLKPAVEFYLGGLRLPGQADLNSTALYMTGDEKTTTQYLIQGTPAKAILLIASISLDPYSALLSPYRQEFLGRLKQGSEDGKVPGEKGKNAQEPFSALQQFARGQTAQLAYCGSRDNELAAEAYRRAITHGFADKVWLAEAHHRLGLALQGQGRFAEARAEMERSLAIRPNVPEVLNNLGTVFMKLQDRDKALQVLEKAVTLRPNYPMARFNLAEVYEFINAKRAIAEYETYLALVQGIPEEAARAAQVRERVKALRR